MRMPIERISSGIVELDRCLQNGFPSGYVINVRGEPGAGKTLFVTQVATKNAERGLKTVYVLFWKTAKNL
jgi:RecA-superfamily ATPases implicated in signal transduction